MDANGRLATIPPELLLMHVNQNLIADRRMLDNEMPSQLADPAYVRNRERSVETWLVRQTNTYYRDLLNSDGYELKPTLANVMEYYLVNGRTKEFLELHFKPATATEILASMKRYDVVGVDSRQLAQEVRRKPHYQALRQVYAQQAQKLFFAAGRDGRPATKNMLYLVSDLMGKAVGSGSVTVGLGLGRLYTDAMDYQWHKGIGTAQCYQVLAHILEADNADAFRAFLKERAPQLDELLVGVIYAYRPTIHAECAKALLDHVQRTKKLDITPVFAFLNDETMPVFEAAQFIWEMDEVIIEDLMPLLLLHALTTKTASFTKAFLSRFIPEGATIMTFHMHARVSLVAWAIVSGRRDLLTSVFGDATAINDPDVLALLSEQQQEIFVDIIPRPVSSKPNTLLSVREIEDIIDFSKRNEALAERLHYQTHYRYQCRLSPVEWKKYCSNVHFAKFLVRSISKSVQVFWPAGDARYDGLARALVLLALVPKHDDTIFCLARLIFDRRKPRDLDALYAAAGEVDSDYPASVLQEFVNMLAGHDPTDSEHTADVVCDSIERFITDETSPGMYTTLATNLQDYASHTCVRRVLKALYGRLPAVEAFVNRHAKKAETVGVYD